MRGMGVSLYGLVDSTSARTHGVLRLVSLTEMLDPYHVSRMIPVPLDRTRNGRALTASVRPLVGAGPAPVASENWLYMKSSVPLGHRNTLGVDVIPSVRLLAVGASMNFQFTSSVA